MSLRTNSADPFAHQTAAAQRSLAWCVFLSFFALYLLSTIDYLLVSGDSMAMVESATRLLHHGIGQGQEQMHGKWCLGQVLIDTIIVKLDELFADTPVQNLLQVRIQSIVPASFAAAMPALVFLIGLRLGYARLTSVLAALCVGIGSITWVYSQVLFSETTLALLWLVAVYAVLSFTHTGRVRWLWLAGFAGGYALITKTVSAVALPVLPLWVIASQWSREQSPSSNLRRLVSPVLALSIPLVAFAALNLWYNYARFGSLFNSGYTAERDGDSGGFTTPMLVGLFGLVLSPGKGFFFYSPITLLSLLGMRSFLSRHRALGLSLLGIIATLVLAHTRWWAWHGDWAWGPRFMVPLTPLVGLFGLHKISQIINSPAPQRRVRSLLAAALLSLSIGIQVLGLAFQPGRFIDIASAQCGILRGGTYFSERKFPLLDDGLIVHFVPHFSPISGHYWLLRANLAHDDRSRSRILHSPPWRKLNPLWVPHDPDSIDTNVDVWWLRLEHAQPETRAVARAWLAALWILLAVAATLVVKRLQPSAAHDWRSSASPIT